jgi:hypothetical protein
MVANLALAAVEATVTRSKVGGDACPLEDHAFIACAGYQQGGYQQGSYPQGTGYQQQPAYQTGFGY